MAQGAQPHALLCRGGRAPPLRSPTLHQPRDIPAGAQCVTGGCAAASALMGVGGLKGFAARAPTPRRTFAGVAMLLTLSKGGRFAGSALGVASRLGGDEAAPRASVPGEGVAAPDVTCNSTTEIIVVRQEGAVKLWQRGPSQIPLHAGAPADAVQDA